MTSTTPVVEAPPANHPRQQSSRGDKIVDLVSRYGTIASLVTCIAVFSLLGPEVFATSQNFFNVLNQVAILGIIALGLTVALVQGLFDLSLAGMATLGGFLACKWLAEGTLSSPILAVLIVLALALAIGAFNGVVVAYGGVSAFIVTLAMGSILTGVTLGVSDSQTVLSGIPDGFLIMGQGEVGPIPTPVVILAVVGAAVMLFNWIVINFVITGLHSYA